MIQIIKKKLIFNINDDSGVAMIIVLCFLALAALITSSIIVTTQISLRDISMEVDRTYSGYLAEGTAARLQWLIMNEINNLSKNNLTTSSKENTREYPAYGKTKHLNYYGTNISFKVFDMISGFNILSSKFLDNMNSLKYIISEHNTQTTTYTYSAFINNLKKYIAKNSSSSYYSKASIYKHGDPEYRDELLMIPGGSVFFKPDEYGQLSIFTIIPPANLTKLKENTNFFAADKIVLMSICNYSESEADNIIKSKNKFLNSTSSNFQNFISNSTYNKIKNKFSIKPSGYYTFIIKASLGKDLPQRTFIVSTRINKTIDDGIYYYQYIIY